MKPIEIALSEYGIHDILGPGSNPNVLKYYAKIGQNWVKDDDVAWCAAFVGYCLEMANINSTKALNARSYLNWGKPTVVPKLGDIVILWRVAKNSIYGHVSFFLKQKDGVVWCLGGNQDDQVCISQYPVDKVLGFRTY